MAFHLPTNRASERMIRKMSQVLCLVVRPDQLDWPKHLPMTEFTINSSMSASTGFTPFELTYGYLPRIIQSVGESLFSGVQDFTDDVWDMVIHAHNVIIASRVNQTHQANQQLRGDDPLLEVGRKAYLSTFPLKTLTYQRPKPKSSCLNTLDLTRSSLEKEETLIICLPYQTSCLSIGYTLHFMPNSLGPQS
jgi:hypothetical protein